ncbi:MAG TPA: hypothetical protein VM290_04725 [Gaiellaceae bacterium]|nr:hypothetical protein [Gaiellaceae bacterium]
MPKGILASVSAAVVAAALAGPAAASELIDRNASNVKLAVNAKGEALLSYRVGGQTRRVLAWGAVDAIAPTRSRAQVKFRLDYSGGWGTYKKRYWETFRNVCRAYDGPKLQWLVTACKAPDGSYWGVQAWQRMLPNYGLAPTPKQAVWELRLSHWTGEIAQLEVNLNWAYRQYDHLFGRFTYRGQPVHGFKSTSTGVPLDTFGRNLYVDTLNSAYGRGWKRENSFLMHQGTGAFCYGFFPHGNRPVGKGERYRATIIGPGVTPDVYWEAPAPGPYSRELDLVANEAIAALGSGLCKPN